MTKPSINRKARRKRRIWTSSSMTRTTGAGSFIGAGLELRGFGCERQIDRNGGSLVGAGAHGLQPAAIGGHEGARDPQSQAGARGGGGGALRPEEALADLRLLVFGEAGAMIVDGEDHAVAVALGRHVDGRAGGRIF